MVLTKPIRRVIGGSIYESIPIVSFPYYGGDIKEVIDSALERKGLTGAWFEEDFLLEVPEKVFDAEEALCSEVLGILYLVNGEEPLQGIGEYQFKKHDFVELIYTPSEMIF
ncbi:MAG: hypothetical protein WDZ77_00900 [Candidatus Pacearchaeota archaeon]